MVKYVQRDKKALEYHRNYMRRWYKTEKGEESRKKTQLKYKTNPKNKERIKLYNQRPDVKEKVRSYWRSEKAKEIKRKYWRNKRIEAIKHYGGECDCCGIKEFEFLAFDHINGGGIKHKKEVGYSDLFKWLIKNKYPEGFRILCHNCNQSLGHYGYCPHKKDISEIIKLKYKMLKKAGLENF